MKKNLAWFFLFDWPDIGELIFLVVEMCLVKKVNCLKWIKVFKEVPMCVQLICFFIMLIVLHGVIVQLLRIIFFD